MAMVGWTLTIYDVCWSAAADCMMGVLYWVAVVHGVSLDFEIFWGWRGGGAFAIGVGEVLVLVWVFLTGAVCVCS
ncbi:hypothetical protein FN846DRAFT_975335 [Sphaerosporella brunnea]|uniref:Transmembrane protein n=1 Tax=Sphaerosporella brunnea TaxID=1250544 RepID=A0A5J5EFU4_9PEZI|nr:hypothetical protein FN846DRAFT_975335 [Sphaerosporella brunnea]